MTEDFNDNAPLNAAPDANGHAAILLVESLIHSLVAASVITLAQAIEVVEVASDVNAEIVDGGDGAQSLGGSRRILEILAISLSRDLPRD